jgi:hypothetical protein
MEYSPNVHGEERVPVLGRDLADVLGDRALTRVHARRVMRELGVRSEAVNRTHLFASARSLLKLGWCSSIVKTLSLGSAVLRAYVSGAKEWQQAQGAPVDGDGSAHVHIRRRLQLQRNGERNEGSEGTASLSQRHHPGRKTRRAGVPKLEEHRGE